nr:MAG TPA: hypothetical protein [Caudoviricetes sp.]DAP43039.1 MAG TPA: hypothetical protein [Caudoviricetes sp.]
MQSRRLHEKSRYGTSGRMFRIGLFLFIQINILSMPNFKNQNNHLGVFYFYNDSVITYSISPLPASVCG